MYVRHRLYEILVYPYYKYITHLPNSEGAFSFQKHGSLMFLRKGISLGLVIPSCLNPAQNHYHRRLDMSILYRTDEAR